MQTYSASTEQVALHPSPDVLLPSSHSSAPGSRAPLPHSHSHVCPSPVEPEGQAQVKLPVVLVQVALVSQLSVFVLHSLMSAQPLSPSPL